ncbi:MAG: orotidine-5'-phosphate decarboxylase [Gammaproteobacteria bacterium]|jgi:orotidine-5'-phosphate decarboxylase|nr:orotidine-5'-phosphate decarboxylase [Gammaproteobacteria bacterium]
MNDPKILVALDYPQQQQAIELVAQLDPAMCRLKVGKEMFTRFGPVFIEKLQARGFQVFLDLKYHDIPNTVAAACAAAADLGVWMINVHALGGRRMMLAAAEALAKKSQPPLLIAVTVLTSMSGDDLADLGIKRSPAELALSLAVLSKNAGLDGIVCSAQEAAGMRQQLGKDFILVTPGIRLADSAADDQRRIMTPRAAMQSGASYLVIGRPITQADNPVAVLRNIIADIS